MFKIVKNSNMPFHLIKSPRKKKREKIGFPECCLVYRILPKGEVGETLMVFSKAWEAEWRPDIR